MQNDLTVTEGMLHTLIHTIYVLNLTQLSLQLPFIYHVLIFADFPPERKLALFAAKS